MNYSTRLFNPITKESAPININIHTRPPLRKDTAAIPNPAKSTIQAYIGIIRKVNPANIPINFAIVNQMINSLYIFRGRSIF